MATRNDEFTEKDPRHGALPLIAGFPAATLPLFMVTMFLSAWLLFAIQPMFAKLVLPLLGGAPQVWVTAMLFFQAMLLVGYAYVHVTSRWLNLRWQAFVHLVVLIVALASLPVRVASSEPLTDQPILWLITLFTISVGLPFFAISATAPLLQRWFGHSGHDHAHDPYFLYGASNLGSILALLSYPIVVEPSLRLGQQAWTWAGGYALLIFLIVACAIALRRAPSGRSALSVGLPGTIDPGTIDPGTIDPGTIDKVSWGRRLRWVALAFAPSSLLLGVTTRITTDVAAIPMLWVIPLVLYLSTFVVVFSRRPLLRHNWMVVAQPYVLAVVFSADFFGKQWLPSLAGYLAVFFVTAMVCHGELARLRPAVRHLTEFYFAMALGGMLGGVFNALIAPATFVDVYEFAIALALACMLRPMLAPGGTKARVLDVALPLLLLGALLLPGQLDLYSLWPGDSIRYAFLVFAILSIFAFKDRPLRFGLGVGAFLAVQFLAGSSLVVDQARSFFGVYKIVLHQQEIEAYKFKHGTTFHGAQYTDPSRRREPLTYYIEAGPLGQVFAALAGSNRPGTVGLVGLGVGSTLCYQQPDQRWTIYEIDPLVTRIAQDTRYFNYLAECMDDSRTEIIHGDARLSIQEAEAGQFDLLILDAFSSDAVPVHLLTKEAMDLYLDKVSEDGVILFHISNRYITLVRVISGLVEDAGLAGLGQTYSAGSDKPPLHSNSHWVAVGRTKQALAFLADDPRWAETLPLQDSVLWTDDFSNLIAVLK